MDFLLDNKEIDCIYPDTPWNLKGKAFYRVCACPHIQSLSRYQKPLFPLLSNS